MKVTAQPVNAIVVDPKTVEKGDVRRDWALILLAGGGMAMTLFAVACLYLISANEKYVFYMGLAAMVQIFAIFTGFMGLLVKRSLKISKSEISIVDHDVDNMRSEESPKPDDLVIRGDVKKEVEEAVEELPAAAPTEEKNGSTDQPSGRH